MKHSSIIAIARYEPAHIVTNFDLQKRLDTSDDWITTRTGIKTRRQANEQETAGYMARKVLTQLIEKTQLSPDKTGIIIASNTHVPNLIPCVSSANATVENCVAFDALTSNYSTLTLACSRIFQKYDIRNVEGCLSQDHGRGQSECFAFIHPQKSLAQILASEFKLNTSHSFDIATGCASFVYACALADTLSRELNMSYLIVGSERMSNVIDQKDRDTAVLFGDLAAGVTLVPSGCPGILFTQLRTQGNQRNLISMKENVLNEKYIRQSWDEEIIRSLEKNKHPETVAMNGREVFEYGVKTLAEYANLFIQNTPPRRILIPHQANIRIIDAALKRIPQNAIDDVIITLDKFGNSSAASIPHALDIAVETGRIKKGDYVGLVGFGAGLSDGLAVLRWAQ